MDAKMREKFRQNWTDEQRERQRSVWVIDSPVKKSAEWCIDALQVEIDRLTLLAEPGEIPRMECLTGGLVIIVLQLRAGNGNLLRIAGLDSEKNKCVVIATPHQCSFVVSLFTPVTEAERSELVVFGFKDEVGNPAK